MVINIQDDILKLHAAGLLEKLLADKTTGRNILWASDAYGELGPLYARDEPITTDLITGENSDIIKTRARKAMEQQSERTRRRGEVFTPLWVCEKMIDYADEMWFGRVAGFHKTDEQGHIRFTQKRPWQKYVQTTRLEITCGEAPFLVQRYDVETGEAVPVEDRNGILDRKLRAVSENTTDEANWLTWAQKAVQATYGYEFQGDNLLIARVNTWMSVEEHFQHWRKGQGKRVRKLTKPEGRQLCDVIAWNLWQMDGLTGAIPYRKQEESEQFDILYLMDGLSEPEDKSQPLCCLYDWENDTSIEYASLKKESRDMKFDFIIGNPPYQDETLGDNKGFAPPIYHLFMDEAYSVANHVELIHPARFLFNAGSTPKAWNTKMLADPHFKVIQYEPDATRLFSNTEIKGGVVITCHDTQKDYGAIGTFTAYPELNTILHCIHAQADFVPLSSIAVSSYAYHFTDALHADYPDAINLLSKGHAYDLKSNVFSSISMVFLDQVPDDREDYIQILGRIGNERFYKYIKASYITEVKNLYSWKVFMPKANSAGVLGETLSPSIIAGPNIGSTESFLSIGSFGTRAEAEALNKYIKTKIFRVLLGVLKTTQDVTPQKFTHVPLQDFTPSSDIDWSQSIPDIDRQLYAKYGLDETEIEFIETHVKAME